MRSDQRLGEFADLVKSAISDRVLRDSHACVALSTRRYCVIYQASVHCGSWGDVLLSTLIRRLNKMSDLMTDSNALWMHFTVKIALHLRPVVKSLGMHDLVQDAEACHPVRYYRLGNVSIPNDYPDNDIRNLPYCHKGRTAFRKVETKYVWALLGSYKDHGSMLHLTKVHAYDFDDFCIGDCTEWEYWNKTRFNTKHEYCLPYETISSRCGTKGELEHLLQEYVTSGAEQPGSGVIFLPTYCFNTFKPSGVGRSMWPKHGIATAVRCVSHVDDDETTAALAFPSDIQLIVDEEDTHTSITRAICNIINIHSYQHGCRANSARLFDGTYAGAWAMELWVMPQIGERKLYKWVEAGGIGLQDFLSDAPTVRKNDKRLYVEAHIVRAEQLDR